jgi:hypothetical protein
MSQQVQQIESLVVNKDVVKYFVNSLRAEKTKRAYLLAFRTILGEDNPVSCLQPRTERKRKISS